MVEIAVVGAGLTGVMLAANLLRTGFRGRVHLFEKGSHPTGGIAYATQDDRHLLNAPNSTMSLFPEDPDHFNTWLNREGGAPVARGAFVRRSLYGEYLDHEFKSLHKNFSDQIVLHVNESVTRLEYDTSGKEWSVSLERGTHPVRFAKVFLATGWRNLPLPFHHELPRFYASPWSFLKEAPSIPLRRVAVIGSGLTAVDVILSLKERDILFEVFSDTGRFPQPHSEAKYAALPEIPTELLANLKSEPSIERSRQRLTEWIKEYGARDFSWQSCFGSLRRVASDIWQAWTLAQRKEFASQFLNLWSIHRHRIPASSSHAMESLIAEGRLSLHKQRIHGAEVTAEGKLQLSFAGTHLRSESEFDAVVSCAGVGVDWGSPLLNQLLSDGYIEKDEMGWGIRVNSEGQVLIKGGLSQKGLWAMGPLGLGSLFEITGVPEIRDQVKKICEQMNRGE